VEGGQTASLSPTANWAGDGDGQASSLAVADRGDLATVDPGQRACRVDGPYRVGVEAAVVVGGRIEDPAREEAGRCGAEPTGSGVWSPEPYWPPWPLLSITTCAYPAPAHVGRSWRRPRPASSRRARRRRGGAPPGPCRGSPPGVGTCRRGDGGSVACCTGRHVGDEHGGEVPDHPGVHRPADRPVLPAAAVARGPRVRRQRRAVARRHPRLRAGPARTIGGLARRRRVRVLEVGRLPFPPTATASVWTAP
jgi:hypothetical protein